MRTNFLASATLALTLLVASTGHARGFRDLDLSRVCDGARSSSYGDFVACTRAPDYDTVRAAKKSGPAKPPSSVALRFQGAIELGLLPDADTNQIYYYVNGLVDSRGRAVGYLVVSGYQNSEMGLRAQLSASYNRRGDLITASWSER